MDKDTMTVGVSPDGIKNRTDIRILICYMLDQFPEPLTKGDIIELIYTNQFANYLETLSAIEHLIDNEHLMHNAETDALLLAPLGKRVTDEMSDRLPNTIRQKSRRAIDRMLSRRRNERDNGFDVLRQEDGFRVTFTIGSKNPDQGIMSLSCFLPTTERVNEARERFYNDPEGLYRLVYAQITGDESLLDRGE